MYINYLYKVTIILVISTLTFKAAISQFGNDSVFYVKQSPFMVDLIKKETNYSAIFSGNIRLYGFVEQGNEFIYDGEFIQVPSVGFFFHVYNTGRLYKLVPNSLSDTALVFKRIDATINFYYNIGSFLFSYKNQIYDFGGYGFWKNNGLIRRFNFKDKEWDVVELEKEIFPPNYVSDGHVTWIDSTHRFLFVPFQEIRNDGVAMLKEDDDISYDSHRLDLATLKWEYLGQMDNKVHQVMKFASHIFQSNKGLLLVYINRIYWVDYMNNTIKVTFDPTIGQTLLRVQPFMLRYWNNDYVYWSNPVNGLYDSVRIDLSKFSDSGQVVWKKKIQWKDVLLFVLIAFALLLFFITQVRNYRKKQIGATELSTTLEAPFSGTETALLDLLLNRREQGKTVTIPEINYVLGLKDKNHGMQKKVRSEIINRINEKYTLISKGKDTLIQNIRSESDKRFFEYLLNPDLVAELRKLMAQSA